MNPRSEPPRRYRVLKPLQLPHIGMGLTLQPGQQIELPPEYAARIDPGFLEAISRPIYRTRRMSWPAPRRP